MSDQPATGWLTAVGSIWRGLGPSLRVLFATKHTRVDGLPVVVDARSRLAVAVFALFANLLPLCALGYWTLDSWRGFKAGASLGLALVVWLACAAFSLLVLPFVGAVIAGPVMKRLGVPQASAASSPTTTRESKPAS